MVKFLLRYAGWVGGLGGETLPRIKWINDGYCMGPDSISKLQVQLRQVYQSGQLVNQRELQGVLLLASYLQFAPILHC